MKALSPAQLDRFRELGYVFPCHAMSSDRARGLRRRLEAFEKSDLAAQYAGREHELYRFKAHLLFTWVDEIVHNERSLDVVEDLIGPDILVWTVGVFVKEPHSDYAIPWHQDSVYTGVDRPDQLVRGWHALTSSRPENGTLRFSPRSHRLGDLRHISGSKSDGLTLREARADHNVDEEQADFVNLQPGEAAFFNCRTLHASGPNRTDERRINVVVTYMPTCMTPASNAESAMLVRGVDTYGRWKLEPRPHSDMDAATIAAHKEARAARLETYFRD